MKRFILLTFLAGLFSLPACAQIVNSPSGGAGFSYTGALSGIPATCTVGQIAFITDATPGQNQYNCTATNTWTQNLNSGVGGASVHLDNLSAVSINTSLLAQTGVDAGSTAHPFRNLFLFGGGTYGSTYFEFTGTPTSTRTITIPDASITLARTDAAQTFTGVQTFSTPIALTSLASTVVNASSPGVGLCHFAGSTQTCTSSAVNLAGADVTGVLPGANGGTGVANTGFTITLAGNLVTTGAFNTTFAQGATTTVTLPSTSSTMARTDAGQTFTGTQTFSTPIALTSLASTVVNATNPAVGLCHFAGSTQTCTSSTVATADIASNAVTLAKLATQAADTVLMNATSGSAVPAAVAMPTTGTNGCAGASNALIYNTSTHALGCNSISAGGAALSSLTAATGSNTLANGNNGLQIWNWAPTSNQVSFTFGETTAATSGTLGSQYGVQFITLAGSTSVPVNITSSLTGSQTLPSLHITPTWNTSGVVDAALLINPTNTASGTGSLLIDAQLGGTSQWKVDKAGNTTQLGSMSVGSSAPACTGTGIVCLGETTGQGNVSAADAFMANSSSHQMLLSNDNDTALPVALYPCQHHELIMLPDFIGTIGR